jgi:hypothetical protein
MVLRSKKHPEIEDVPDAIVYYYTEKQYSMDKIARYLGLTPHQVRRVLDKAATPLREVHERRTFGNEGDEDASRVCRVCGENHPLTVQYWHRDKSRPHGLFTICRECRKQQRL